LQGETRFFWVLRFEEIFRLDICLFKNGAERALRQIAGMVGNRCVTVRLRIVPDLVAAGRMAVEGESQRTQLFDYL
jgi:hypothetical protein